MATSSRQWQQLAECPVCLSPFEEPKALYCGHSVCVRCVAGLAGDGAVVCPVCRVESLPDDLATNYALAAFVEQVAVARRPAHRCAECDGLFIANEVYVCTDCNRLLVCFQCAIGIHNGHQLGTLLQAIEQRRTQIDEWKTANEDERQSLNEKRQCVADGKEKLEWRLRRLIDVLRGRVLGDFSARALELLASCDDLQNDIGSMGNVETAEYAGMLPELADETHSAELLLAEMGDKLEQYLKEQERYIRLVTRARDAFERCMSDDGAAPTARSSVGASSVNSADAATAGTSGRATPRRVTVAAADRVIGAARPLERRHYEDDHPNDGSVIEAVVPDESDESGDDDSAVRRLRADFRSRIAAVLAGNKRPRYL